jgi:hypothetical protein
MARAFREAETNTYYADLKVDLQARRDYLVNALTKAGLTPIVSALIATSLRPPPPFPLYSYSPPFPLPATDSNVAFAATTPV